MLFYLLEHESSKAEHRTHVEQLAECFGMAPALGLKLGRTVTLPVIVSAGPWRAPQVTALQAERLGKWQR